MNLCSERIQSGLGKFPPQTQDNSSVNKQSSLRSQRPRISSSSGASSNSTSLFRAGVLLWNPWVESVFSKEPYRRPFNLGSFSRVLPPTPHPLCPTALKVRCIGGTVCTSVSLFLIPILWASDQSTSARVVNDDQ